MIRNLKVLGLALVAVFAMASVSASAASAANGTLTSEGPFYLKGTDEATGNHLTYIVGGSLVASVTCPESHYLGEKVNSSSPIPNDSSTITVTPTYTNCESAGAPATVTMNGCDYVFHIGETTGTGNTYNLSADLVCPETSPGSGVFTEVEVEVYSGAEEGLRICKVKFAKQSGLTGATVSETGTNTALVSGTLTGISAVKSGLCGASSTTEAKYDVNVTLHGFNEEGAETHVSITHT